MTNRSWPRIASATAATSLAVVWGEFIDQLRHADPAFDRRIVLERQLGSSLQMQLARDLRLQDGMRGLQSGESLQPLALGAKDGHEDARVPEIPRRLDSRHGDESDPRVLQLSDSFGEHLPNRF